MAPAGILGHVWMMKGSHRSVLQSGLLFVGFLALLGLVGMTFWLGERSQTYFNEVIEARDTRGAAVELRNALVTAESSQRGFIFTGNEIYLAPYDTAKTQATRQLDNLKRLLAPFGRSEIMSGRLTTIIAEKFDEMDRTIALKRERRDDELQTIVQTNRGKALMDEANVFFSGVIRAADDRLTKGVGEQRENARWLRTFSIVDAAVVVVMVGAAATSLVLYAREARAARDEIAELNAGLERRVAERTADLAQANEEIRRFAHIVTHDLRAPLISIMGFTSEIEHSVKALEEVNAGATDAAQSDMRSAASRDLIEAIGFVRSSTRRMDQLISAILKLSREGRRVLRPEEVVLRDVVEASVAAIQHQLTEADGEIAYDIDVPTMSTDRLSLEQIFGNLFDNAVKYRAPERPLRIVIRAALRIDDRVAIDIADNGRGIAEEDLERVFELFRRSGPQDQPGEGLGLAYVRAIVRNLGGDIGLTSTLGEGSTFRIVLPRTLNAAADAA